ncbi:putative zinc-binding metallopeptidase [Tardiphaga sp.]|uniref:zinc-binding metallopeptidase family protein n=1 Tax=Tardiphaga sp. TaxID=1926292 RepID=UPI00352A9540
MKQLICPNCQTRVFFEQSDCAQCGEALIFDTARSNVVSVASAMACANRDLIACNWATDESDPFCPSCRLTRTIPNLASDRNVALWKRVEQAKRRLTYDLMRLRLPLAVSSGAHIAFDILSDETAGHPIMTGHLSGLITMNLSEADDAEREARRAAFREPYRTLLGHFRHEVGHFYWEALVDQSQLIGPFRMIFGDETRDYGEALAAYHNRADRLWNSDAFISEYATSHPWEDWAETFAHFLHIVSTLDTASSLPLSLDERSRHTLDDPYLERDFEALLSLWDAVSYSMNELNRSMGMSDAYPFHLTQAVRGKLHFVHLAILKTRSEG